MSLFLLFLEHWNGWELPLRRSVEPEHIQFPRVYMLLQCWFMAPSFRALLQKDAKMHDVTLLLKLGCIRLNFWCAAMKPQSIFWRHTAATVGTPESYELESGAALCVGHGQSFSSSLHNDNETHLLLGIQFSPQSLWMA
jgi:hypothetical protein